MENKLIRELFLGFIRIHILYHAAKSSVFGAELMEELARHGYRIGPGTMYPILHSMEEKGLLSSEKTPIEGKVRRYYRITSSGKLALDSAKQQALELINEIMEA